MKEWNHVHLICLMHYLKTDFPAGSYPNKQSIYLSKFLPFSFIIFLYQYKHMPVIKLCLLLAMAKSGYIQIVLSINLNYLPEYLCYIHVGTFCTISPYLLVGEFCNLCSFFNLVYCPYYASILSCGYEWNISYFKPFLLGNQLVTCWL